MTAILEAYALLGSDIAPAQAPSLNISILWFWESRMMILPSSVKWKLPGPLRARCSSSLCLKIADFAKPSANVDAKDFVMDYGIWL